jgi:hypothetical protein
MHREEEEEEEERETKKKKQSLGDKSTDNDPKVDSHSCAECWGKILHSNKEE